MLRNTTSNGHCLHGEKENPPKHKTCKDPRCTGNSPPVLQAQYFPEITGNLKSHLHDNFRAYKIHKNLLSQKNPMRWLPLILLQQSGTEVRRGEALCSALGCPPLPRSRTPRAQGSQRSQERVQDMKFKLERKPSFRTGRASSPPAFWRVAEKHTHCTLRIQPAPDAGRHE